jgi:type VI secretion system protein ImpD
VLLGDYELHPRPGTGHPTDDLEALRSISQVAAAAFAPFIAAAHPSLLGLDDFGELERSVDLERIHSQPEFVKWRSLRESEDSRFVSLVLPRTLMRRPYADDGLRHDGFRYREAESEPLPNEYLWGNACYALGGVLLRTFEQTRWLADIRGVRRGEESAGLVTGLATRSFGTDGEGVSVLGSTEVAIVDSIENGIAAAGFVPLCHLQGSEFSAFFSCPSIQQPREYDRETSTENARLSGMMQYVLCVSRVAHYLKVIGRDKIGSFAETSDCEAFLNEWLEQYVLRNDEAAADMKAQYPLREARVEVRELPGAPGEYGCVIHLQPHYQLDDLASTMRLTTRLHSSEG